MEKQVCLASFKGVVRCVPCICKLLLDACSRQFATVYCVQAMAEPTAQQIVQLSQPQRTLLPCWNALSLHGFSFQSAKVLNLSSPSCRTGLPPDLWLKVAASLQYREVFLLSAMNKTLHRVLSAAPLVVVNHCSPPADCGSKDGRLYKFVLRNAGRICVIQGWKELRFATWGLQPSLLHNLRVLDCVRLRLEQAALLPGCLSELSCIFEPLGPLPPGLHRQLVQLVVLRHLTQLSRLSCFSESDGFRLGATAMWGKLLVLTLNTRNGSIVLSPEWQAPKLTYIHLHGSLLYIDQGLYLHPAYFPRLVHVGLGGFLVQYLDRGLPPSVCSLALTMFGPVSQPKVTHLSGIRLLDINYSNKCLLVLPANLEVLLLKDAYVSLDSRLCKLKLHIIVNEGSRLSWDGAPPGESQVNILTLCADKQEEWVQTHFWSKML